MYPNSPAQPPTRGVDEQFVDLICADQDLIRSEFDAIVAAEWPTPPPTRPRRIPQVERRPRSARRLPPVPVMTRPKDPGCPAISRWMLPRSPPGDVPTKNRCHVKGR